MLPVLRPAHRRHAARVGRSIHHAESGRRGPFNNAVLLNYAVLDSLKLYAEATQKAQLEFFGRALADIRFGNDEFRRQFLGAVSEHQASLWCGRVSSGDWLVSPVHPIGDQIHSIQVAERPGTELLGAPGQRRNVAVANDSTDDDSETVVGLPETLCRRSGIRSCFSSGRDSLLTPKRSLLQSFHGLPAQTTRGTH